MAGPIITAFVWDSYVRCLADAAREIGVDLRAFTRMSVSDSMEEYRRFESSASESDLVIVHLMGNDAPEYVDRVLNNLPATVKVLSFGKDPMTFAYTTGPKEAALKCYEYLSLNGRDNVKGCLLYLLKTIFDEDVDVPEVIKTPMQGILDSKGTRYDSLEDFIEKNPPIPDAPWVGIITSRTSWVNDNCDIEYELVKGFRRNNVNSILVYSSPRTIPEEDMLGLADSVMKYMVFDGRFLPSAMVKCTVLLYGKASAFGRETEDGFLRSLDVPVFQPVIPSSMTRKTFVDAPGLKRDVSYDITFQEFEGAIEPILIGFSREDTQSESHRKPIAERTKHLIDRVIRRIRLREIPNREKKVAFILNNYPCAGAEANVGEAKNLNVMDSLANIFREMRARGYTVNAPDTGKGIMDCVLEHKALSDFRWTNATEIERCGGVLYHMSQKEYSEWFCTLSEKVREDVKKTWGEPPGEAMVTDGAILITGVSFGNVLVMVQPKRGCYGPKCDGTVCRILHDPVCPPTHQYLATYHWLDSVWGADAVVHTGMHGNLERLPGKTAGLTSDCYPDICIGTMPHLYIFDAGSPPAASAAKRRSYATLINHLPPAMERVKAYGPYEDLRVTLEGYESAKDDPLRATEYRKMLVKAGLAAGMDAKDLSEEKSLEDILKICTEEYTRFTSTRVAIGLHVMGSRMSVRERASMIVSILSYGKESLCIPVAALKGIDYETLETEPEYVDSKMGRPNAVVAAEVYDETVASVESVLEGRDSPFDRQTVDKIIDISKRIDDSDEIGAFLHSLDGGFTPPGPSGLITRGRPEILPTGRNPFIIDPRGIPTRTSWRTGIVLAEKTIEKYMQDTGRMPETVSMFWTSSDLMNDGGEMMCQILYLIGVRPVWSKDGQVTGFDIIPTEELGRPRIDVTVRGSGILLDTFGECADLVDSAFVAVSALDEDEDSNYVKKHTLQSIAEGIPAEDATARLFSSAPGSATSGVPLAIFANAWKTERDLADIYVATNGYAYGNDRNGKPMHQQFIRSLSSTSVSYTKMGTDEYDILGSPGFFGNIGGMAIAAKTITGKEIKSYFGDTRNPGNAGVRTLKDEIRRVVKTRLLNPQWIEGMKSSGYQGAAEIMKRSGAVYGYGATTDSVDDRIFDEIAETFVNDPEMQRFFRDNNIFAGEEIARRLLEASERGFWKADPEVLEKLKRNYLEFEGDLEGMAGDSEYQGSSTEIAAYYDVDAWKESNGKVMDSVRKMMDSNSSR